MKEIRRQAAIFLDRDGTINEEVGYLDRLEALRPLPGAAEAIRRINASGMKTVVITNQSGVARGLYDEMFIGRTHDLLRELLLREGARLDGFYFCPHHPTAGIGEYLRVCDCRKPAPGMLLRAAKELDIDLSRSWMVGDTLNDIEAGRRAGVLGILVRTGYGEEELRKLEEARSADPRQPKFVAADLLEAVEWILRNREP